MKIPETNKEPLDWVKLGNILFAVGIGVMILIGLFL